MEKETQFTAEKSLLALISETVRPIWEELIATTPEVLEDMTFEDFVKETYLELP